MGVFVHEEVKSHTRVPAGRLLYVYTSATGGSLADLTDHDGNSIANPIVLGSVASYGQYAGVQIFKCAGADRLWGITDYDLANGITQRRPLVCISPSDVSLAGLTATAGDLNINASAPASITFSPAAGPTNVCEVTIAVKDAAGATIAKPFMLEIWLSDANSGAGLTAVTASGTVQAKANSGTVIDAHVAKKALLVQTLATGVFILEITDSAKTGFYVAAMLPSSGITRVSAQLTSANYGS